MKLFFSGSLVLASILAMGCSSTSGSSSRVGTASSALSIFREPTGTFDVSSGKSAVASMWAQKQQGSSLQQTPGAAGLATQSMKPLTDALGSSNDGTASSGSSCAEGATCACAGGGSFSYRREASSEGQAARISFSDCRGASGAGFDGEALVVVSQTPLLVDDRLPKATSGESVLFAAEGAALEGSARKDVTLAILVQSNVLLVAVDVPDGKVVLGALSDGRIVVRAKNASWTCAPSAASYTCTAEGSGETIVVERSGEGGASAGASDDAPAPAPKG